MNQAISIVEEIMKNEDNYDEYGLAFPEKIRSWKAFNMLVGENGAGKSRVLRLIKQRASEKCIVFHLDFANFRRNNQGADKFLETDSKDDLIEKIFFVHLLIICPLWSF